MKLRSFWHFSQVTYFIIDCVLMHAAVICAFKLSPSYTNEVLLGPWLNNDIWFVGYGMPLAMALGLQLADLQRSRAGFRAVEALLRATSGITSGILIFLFVNIVVEYQLVGRYVLMLSLLYGIAFVLGSRMLIWNLAGQDCRNVLVYGCVKTYHDLLAQIDSSLLPIRLVGRVQLPELSSARVGDTNSRFRALELFRCIRKAGASEIVVEKSESLSQSERAALLAYTARGIEVATLNLFIERNLERVNVASLSETWFWNYDPAHRHPTYFAIKRLSDVGLSLLGLLFFIPFAPIISLLIKLQDGGPVFYVQERVGLNSKRFRILKYRTMRIDAETDGAQWAAQRDSRATFLGRFLRRTRIDEVPQFVNILRGDMSFIGPRPERPEFVAKIEHDVPFYRYRHLIKPGLSGWAQINYPYGSSIEDARQKLAFDLYYLKYASTNLDLLIVLRTLVAMVKGAR